MPLAEPKVYATASRMPYGKEANLLVLIAVITGYYHRCLRLLMEMTRLDPVPVRILGTLIFHSGFFPIHLFSPTHR